ncbi:MAG: cation transporter [Coriobacteriia bacterium]|nr:cation transporter [Coriobacteriia bacterium]
MRTIEIKTTGTHCPSCSMLIEMSVGDLDGVRSVSSDYAAETATVEYDPEKVSAEAIVAEVEKAGYSAEVLD